MSSDQSPRESTEIAFLGCALLDPDVLASSFLDHTMFSRHGAVMKILVELSAKTRVSGDDVSTLLRAGIPAETIALLNQVPSAANWEYYQDSIFKAWATDQTRAAYRLAISQGYPDSSETVERALTAVAIRHTKARTKPIGELIEPAMQRILDRKKLGGRIPGISFGLETVDDSTMGAQPGQLITIGARPSDGKSALAAQIMRHIAKEKKAGIFMLESDELEFMTRLFASEARVDSRRVQSGLLNVTELANLKLAIGTLQAIGENLMVHDQPGIKFPQLAAVARRMVREGCEIIFVDYLQLVRFPGKDRKFDEVGAVSTGLKELARELKIPIVALAQLGRDADDKRPTLGDFQHSSQIEQDSDQCWLIWHKRDSSGNITESRIILAKVRGGLRRDVAVKFDGPVMMFYEVVADDPTTSRRD